MKLVNHLDFNGFQAKKMLLEKSATISSPVQAQIYYDTDDNRTYIHNGTSFDKTLINSVDLGTSEAIGTLAAARLGAFAGDLTGSATYSLTVATVGGAAAADIADAVTKRHTQNTDTGTTSTTFALDSDAGTPVKLKNNAGVIEGRNDADNAYVAAKFSIVTLTADPTNALEAATKQYVDAVATGLDVKKSVRVATAAALPAYTRTGNVITATANGALAAIDGVTLVLNDRLLLKNGAAGADNGLYYVSQVGDAGNPYTLTRVTDADTDAEVTAGLFTFIEEGTTLTDTGWVLSTNNPITLNTTSLTFTQFSSAGVVVGDETTITKTGNTFSLVTGIATPGTYESVTVDTYGRVTAGTNPTNGYAASIGNGTDTDIAVTHSLGTRDVLVEVYDNATYDTIYAGVVRTSTSAVTISFGVAPASNAYRVLVRKAV